ncbi:DNA primase [Selenihalanaerobacter shriftii]|uniref:DNA primase n=1 Tax=Selenihalanaerobacter shriftii TaxID=142842 RepID=A0A1T4MYG0_9FIRM|nr:DNA primase [Selenihalanaerobacter shriftii]SJZ71688.1 DNA primase [Selenihalanaerobacter shriftii]
MAYINDDFIDEVRTGNNIIDVISDYLKLDQAGNNYKGLCPFHNEKTPSFMVSPEKQLYHCFGCGAGGNVFNFIMEIENLEFVEAVKILAERIGLSLPKQGGVKERQTTEKSEIYEIHDWATKYFNYLLTEVDQGSEAYNYLRQREIKRKTIDKFKLGYAPDSWESLFKFLKKKGYSAQRIHQAGLIIPRKKGKGYYDRFRNRVIFTIFNSRGRVIGFGGRVLDDSHPKYLNSPETMIFNKKRNLYGFNLAKKEIRNSESAIIVEGYTDVITGYQAGIHNMVASLGTSLTKEQAKLLSRYAERAYIAYDGDAAGEQATLRGLNILKKEGIEVYVVDLPSGADPDEVIRERGQEYFNSLLKEAMSLIEFKIEQILLDDGSIRVEDKVKKVDQIIPILAEIDNEIEQTEYVKKVANKIDTEIKAIKARLKKYLYQKDKDRNYKNWDNKDKSNYSAAENDEESNIYIESARKLLELMLTDIQILNLVKEELDAEDFITPKYQSVADLIFGLENLNVGKLLDQVNNMEIKELLTKLSVSINYEEGFGEYQIKEDARGYIKKIKEYQLKMKKEKLEKEIQEYEASGDFAKLRPLLREYQNLFANNSDIIGKEGN